MSLCIKCKKKKASYGFDNKSRVWCVTCAKEEYLVQNISNERHPKKLIFVLQTIFFLK